MQIEPPAVLVEDQPASPRPCSSYAPRNSSPWTALAKKLGRSDAALATISLFDQAFVSGTRFATSIVVGRLCSPSELGIYSLGFAVLVLISNVQESLICTPFTVYGNRTENNRRPKYAGSALVHQLVLAALAAIVLAIGGAGLWVVGSLTFRPTMAWVLACVVPFALLQEFSRRFCFAKLALKTALLWDVVTTALQLSGLLVLAKAGLLSGATAMLSLGLGCAVAGVGWLWRHRGEFEPRRGEIGPDWRQNLAFGRWALLAQSLQVVNNYYIHWLLAFTIGTKATGLYAASMTIVQFANPLMLGVSNVLAPRAARAFREGRQRAVRWVVLRGLAFLAATVGTYCLFIMVFGREVLDLLFGKQYVHDGHTVAVLSCATLVGIVGLATNDGLWALDRPRLSSLTSILGLSVLLTSSWFLVGPYGVLGAAYSTLFGMSAAAAVRSVCFFQLTRTPAGEGERR